MANISAYNISAASQSSGKIANNPGQSGKSGGGMVSFLEILKQSMANANANIKTNAEQQNQNNSEMLVLEENAAVGGVSLKAFEMFGLPQDIAQILEDYFAFAFNGGELEAVSRAQAGEFIEGTMQDERIPEDIRQILSDIALKLKTGHESGVRNLFETALANLHEQNGTLQISASGYIADLLISQNGGTDLLMKERAELMTKAIERFDGTAKPAVITESRTGGTAVYVSQSVKEVQIQTVITETAVLSASQEMSVEDMFNIMRAGKPMAELLSANLDLTQADAKPVINNAESSAAHLNLTQESQNNPFNITAAQSETADIANEEDTIKLSGGTKEANGSETAKAKGPGTENGDISVKSAENKARELARNLMRPQSAQVQSQETDITQSAKEISRLVAENINVKANIKGGAEASRGGFEIKMKLSPKELGDLLIKVAYKNGSVVLDITAANKAAETGILSRISDLRESLAARGMNLETVEVNSGDLDHGGQSNYNSRNNYNNNGNSNHNNQRNDGGSFGFNAKNPAAAANQETARREMIMNHMKNRRLLYRTI